MRAHIPFSDAFIKNKGQPIEYMGRTLFVSLRIDVTTQTTIAIEVLQHKRQPEQVIQVSTRNCQLLNGDSKHGTSSSIAIYVSEWSDEIKLHVIDVKLCAHIFIGNATAEVVRGPIWSGMGNYAMQIESDESGQAFLCRCSQGMWPSKPDFSSLVFRVKVLSDPKARSLVAV